MRTVLLFFFFGVTMNARAQSGYAAGNVVKDFALKKMLRYSSPSSSFNAIKQKITIIDFFGTWCVPCIKALPHLTQLQQKYQNDLRILLVSVEEEKKLQSFISKQTDFSFPIVVDDDNTVSNLFQPTSYPYTVVLNEQGKIVAITDAGSITNEAISKWLSGATEITEVNSSQNKNENITTTVTNNRQKSTNAIVQLSQDFMYAAKTGEDAIAFEESLKNLSVNELEKSLPDDKAKKAFWINLYNGYTQTLLKNAPEKYQNRSAFFKSKQIQVAGKNISLDDIEHGILRRSKIKWSLGYLGKLFPNSFEKKLRVDKIDFRIHFALNCGAKSCPPIAYYNPENIDRQLDLAKLNYLKNEAEYKADENVLYLPAIMSWFRADFGGKKGMKKLLKGLNLIPAGADPKITFKKYDWNLYLDNYATANES